MHFANGLNFASHELNELYKLFNDELVKRKVANFITSKKIEWHFILPRAPYMGDIWETAIKNAKHHLKCVTKEASLRYD